MLRVRFGHGQSSRKDSMKRGPLIFLGIFAALVLSWYGMVVVPQFQFGRAAQIETGPAAVRYPAGRPGLARRGIEIYRANGCYYCHTQLVRHRGLGSDMERNWGPRFSVAQDYLLDEPVMLGDLRIGPDLANIGMRVPNSLVAAGTETNAVALTEWHLQHFYNPQITSPGSKMPPYPFLFEKVRRDKNAPAHRNALRLPEAYAPKSDKAELAYDIVPKEDAMFLVEYMLSLRTELPLFESPFPKTTRAQGGTNVAANVKSSTNSPIPAQAVPAPK
jgi:cytochrome c oxidase cbb3-type subunit II